MATYSTRLYAGQVAGDNTKRLLFTVPAGYRVVIRTIINTQTIANEAHFALYIGTGGPMLVRVDASSYTASTLVDTRIVLHEGEACYGYARWQIATVSIHGYLLIGSGGPIVPGVLPADA